MKVPDKFLWHDLFKLFRKCEVGFYIDDIQPYNKAMASIRMRCYDIMEHLEKKGIHAELYKPFRKYKAVVFTKTRSPKAVTAARKLHAEKIPVFYDAYYEYLEEPSKQNDWERLNILEIVKQAQVVGTCSKEQEKAFSKYHTDIVMIPESVHDTFFSYQKKHEPKDRVTLVYCGYSGKAKDTLCIQEVLRKLQEEYGCRLLFICEKNPQIAELSYEFIRYDQSVIPRQLLEGDIMIAPRPMEGIEKLAHSFTKVAYPLAVGLPAVANPVPSYVDTPVVLCRNDEEWYQTLTRLITDAGERERIGRQGRDYVKAHYSLQVIGEKYRAILQRLGV